MPVAGSPGSRHVHTHAVIVPPESVCACMSAATLVAGTPSSRPATCAARNAGATTCDALPRPAAASMAVRSIVVFSLPAAPFTITSGSVEATWRQPRSAPHRAQRLALHEAHQAGQVRHTWPGCAIPGGSTEKQSAAASPVAKSMMDSRNSAAVACTPASVVMWVTCSVRRCGVHVDASAPQQSSARFATCCTVRSSSGTGAGVLRRRGATVVASALRSTG